jgi:hypothetical protein
MMSNFFHQKYRLFFLVGGIILCIYILSQGVFFVENTFVLAHLNASKNENICSHAHTSLAADHVAPLKRPDFQSGIVYIQWGQDGYGRCNTQWQKGLDDVHSQTGARWLEMPITFTQNSQTTTHITPLPTTPSAASFREGIVTAHAMGYHVFVVPLIGITNGTGRWSGSIHFTNVTEEQQWFNNYWQVFRPYVVAAAQGHADQLAIGTEDEWLERNVPASLWNTFIAQIHSVFPGTLTYDMNWSSLTKPIPSWLANSNISMVGISEYISLTKSRDDTHIKDIASLWKSRVKGLIDTFATQVKKPVFLSELGYRNSTDALYNPWEKITTFPLSPQQQAAAYDAALTNILTDTHIHGIYLWAWDNVDLFNLHNTLAVATIHKWYTSSKV